MPGLGDKQALRSPLTASHLSLSEKLGPAVSFPVYLALLSSKDQDFLMNYGLKILRIRMTWTDQRQGEARCYARVALKTLMLAGD